MVTRIPIPIFARSMNEDTRTSLQAYHEARDWYEQYPTPANQAVYFSVIALNIGRFTHYNGLYGHQMGNKLIHTIMGIVAGELDPKSNHLIQWTDVTIFKFHTLDDLDESCAVAEVLTENIQKAISRANLPLDVTKTFGLARRHEEIKHVTVSAGIYTIKSMRKPDLNLLHAIAEYEGEFAKDAGLFGIRQRGDDLTRFDGASVVTSDA